MKSILGTLVAISTIASILLAACSPSAPAPAKPADKPAQAAPVAAKPVESKPASEAPKSEPPAAKPAQSAPAQKAAEQKTVAPSGQKTRIRLPVLAGTQMFVFQTMQDQKLAEKYNIELDMKPAAGVDALNSWIRAKEVDVAVTGWLTIALYRTQGVDLRIIHPFGVPDTNVLVKKGSPINNLGDLKGKRLGIYGGPAGATTALFRALGIKLYGFDPTKDASVNYGAAPLMAAMLDKDEVDAILMLNPQLTKMSMTGQYKDLGNLGLIWKEKSGEDVMSTAVVTNDTFAKQNPAAVKSFLKAMVEAIDYARSHPETWPGLAKGVGIDTPAGAEELRKAQVKLWFTGMDDKFIKDQTAYAESLIPLMGKDFLPSVPKDLFTKEFLP